MAKLTILAAALIALFALAQATQATITTTVEEQNPREQQERCRQQIRTQQNLRHCQMHLQEMAGGDDVATNTHHLRQCCQQLENLDRECRCEGLREAVRQQKQQGEMKGEMMEEAESLPSMCNLSPRRCQMRASSS